MTNKQKVTSGAKPEAAGLADAATMEQAPAPLIPFDHVLDNHADLAKVVKIVNGIDRYDGLKFIPADLGDVPGLTVRYIAALNRCQQTGKARKEAVSTVEQTRRTVSKALTCYEDLVDSDYPLGGPKSGARAAFFPAGVKDPTEGQRLASMLAGVKTHPLGAYPIEYPLAVAERLLLAIQVDEKARTDAGSADDEAAAAGGAFERATDEIRKRLTKRLHGVYGRSNPILSRYGLTPHAVRGGRKRKAKAPSPQPAAQAAAQAAGGEPKKGG